MNLSSTPQKIFSDGVDFERLRYPRHYALCFPADAVDQKENIFENSG